MVRGIHKLTKKEIRRFIRACVAAGKGGKSNDGGGLYIDVKPTGTASGIFQYERHGKRHEMGLGPLHTFTLAELREKARVARQQLHDGLDPLAEKRRVMIAHAIANPASKPFVFCTREFIKSREDGWGSDKHRQDWENSLVRFAYPVIGNMLVADIATEHVLKVLEPHWTGKTETMMRVRGRIEQVLNWAIAKKFRAAPNPAAWKANLDALLDRNARKATVNHPALDYRELPALVAELYGDERIAAQALLFNIFTLLRTDEIRQLQWDHFKTDQSLVIPPEIMKMKREHKVPLTAPALAMLDALKAVRTDSPYIFTSGVSGKQLGRRSMRDILQKLRPDPVTDDGRKATVHGSVRAGFGTWREEEVTQFDKETEYACLAHAKNDKNAGAYNRGNLFKKRTALMEAWARFVSTPIGGNVAPLRKVF
jgi:integrase